MTEVVLETDGKVDTSQEQVSVSEVLVKQSIVLSDFEGNPRVATYDDTGFEHWKDVSSFPCWIFVYTL
jgi:hypothetical protein